MRATHKLDANQGCLCSHYRGHDLLQDSMGKEQDNTPGLGFSGQTRAIQN
jgi:hypothetical protein